MENEISKYLLNQFTEMSEWVNMYIEPLSDDELKMEFSEGKSHGVWILGHLIKYEDDFSVYMGKDDLLYPEYDELFKTGSKLLPVENYPPIQLLRKQWKEVIEKNKKIYSQLTDEELKSAHGKMEDPEKDFFKTKERVAMFWHLHAMYHAGQFSVLIAKAGKTV
jgi:uncharacterized damage-inducible protein DinB